MKPRGWQITEALVDVLKDFDCSLEEAKGLLQDTVGEFENYLEEAYQRQQDELTESGGSDDSSYRRSLIDAGRGHLVKP